MIFFFLDHVLTSFFWIQHIHIHVHVYVYIHTYIYMYIFLYLYSYRIYWCNNCLFFFFVVVVAPSSFSIVSLSSEERNTVYTFSDRWCKETTTKKKGHYQAPSSKTMRWISAEACMRIRQVKCEKKKMILWLRPREPFFPFFFFFLLRVDFSIKIVLDHEQLQKKKKKMIHPPLFFLQLHFFPLFVLSFKLQIAIITKKKGGRKRKSIPSI